jgi:hypothetical protein
VPAVKEKLLRGEIWPLPGGGTADEIVAVAQEMRMDFCFFDHFPGAPGKARALGLTAGAVVSGPWQRWMIEVGWEDAMMQLGRGTDAVSQGLTRAAKLAQLEMAKWAKAGVDMILLADDVAYAGGPYMSPGQLEKFLLPLYRTLSAGAKAAGATVGFHTDGRVDLILPLLEQAEFQFYSLEPEGTDPVKAWSILKEPIPLFSGLPAAWLAPGGFLPTREGEILREWCAAGPLTVTSACGLFHAEAKTALWEIYQWLDQEKNF